MGRRRVLSFRPILDSLEGRIAMSATQSVAAIAQVAPPVLTRQALDVVQLKIDKAFASYKGEDTAGVLNSIGGLASNVASTILGSSSPTDPNATDTSEVSGGQGDTQALEDRLANAVAHIPYEWAKTPALINKVFGLGGLTPQDSDFFHDLFKKQVNRDVAQGVRTGEFVLKTAGSHHRAG